MTKVNVLLDIFCYCYYVYAQKPQNYMYTIVQLENWALQRFLFMYFQKNDYTL